MKAAQEAKSVEVFLRGIENRNRGFGSRLASLDETAKVELDEREEAARRSWLEHECLARSPLQHMEAREALFFEQLIEKYLSPSAADAAHSSSENNSSSTSNKQQQEQKQVLASLRELRNNCSYCYLILNGFWLLIMFTLNVLKSKMIDKIYFDLRFASVVERTPAPAADFGKYEPVSFCYVMLFAFVLLMQFGAMLWHRVITLTQVIRKTSLLSTTVSSRGGRVSVRRNLNGHVNRQFDSANIIETPEREQQQVVNPQQKDVVITL